LTGRGAAALLAIRVTVHECFFHCAKAYLRAQLWKPETWPPRHVISFGKVLAAKAGLGDDQAGQIDRAVQQDYDSNL
jgi:predicted pyridoxine 5'-phosphate oxidase superfamily flavin-nucleotide-binding protein